MYTIRAAERGDIDTIIELTRREAREAEGLELTDDEVRRGVAGAFGDPPLATYVVAVTAEGGIAASASVVTEWSNFHGGHYWWVQSLFVTPEHRGRGLVDRLLDHLAALAAAGGALDLRLYAHQTNDRAHHVYRRCGFDAAPYIIMRRSLGD